MSPDRLRSAIEAVVRALAPPATYLALYDGTLVAWDDAAQLADVATPAASPLPDVMRRVPVVVDPPGTRVTLAPGTAVLVGFRGGDPAQPYARPAAAFGSAQWVPTEMHLGGPLSIGHDPTPGAAARVGDQAGPFAIVTGSSRVRIGG